MPGHLRTGGYLRHVQPIALKDGITEWAFTFFPGRGPCLHVPLPEAPYKVDVFLAAAAPEWHTGVKLIQDYVNGLLGYGTGLFCTTFFYGYSFSWSSSSGRCCFTQIPLASSEVEGRWQWPSLDCQSFYSTARAFGLTWRPLTGSLFLSSFSCRLKPGPSGERGRKSGLLQDMLVTGLGPTSVRVGASLDTTRPGLF